MHVYDVHDTFSQITKTFKILKYLNLPYRSTGFDSEDMVIIWKCWHRFSKESEIDYTSTCMYTCKESKSIS